MKNTTSSPIGLLVATGPSLKDIPLSFLQGYRSYSANGIFLYEGFSPHHYFCSDIFFLERPRNWNAIQNLSNTSEVWIRWPYHAKMGYKARPLHRAKGIWSYEPDIVVGLGGSVMYQCMQVAYWHGIKTLLIVGLDHDYFDYNTMPKHFDDKYIMNPERHPQVIWGSKRSQSDYSAKAKKLTDRSYDAAREIFEEDGRRIINLTPNTQCESFEKGDWHDWIVDNT